MPPSSWILFASTGLKRGESTSTLPPRSRTISQPAPPKDASECHPVRCTPGAAVGQGLGKPACASFSSAGSRLRAWIAYLGAGAGRGQGAGGGGGAAASAGSRPTQRACRAGGAGAGGAGGAAAARARARRLSSGWRAGGPRPAASELIQAARPYWTHAGARAGDSHRARQQRLQRRHALLLGFGLARDGRLRADGGEGLGRDPAAGLEAGSGGEQGGGAKRVRASDRRARLFTLLAGGAPAGGRPPEQATSLVLRESIGACSPATRRRDAPGARPWAALRLSRRPTRRACLRRTPGGQNSARRSNASPLGRPAAHLAVDA
jgi:hypothetical protein